MNLAGVKPGTKYIRQSLDRREDLEAFFFSASG